MTKLFVYGVNAETPKEMLEEEFSRCGEVTDVYNTGKGFAFVTMADQDGVDAAIEKLHGAELDGQELKVEQARAREDRGGGGMNRSFDRRGGGGGYGGGYGGGRGGGYGGGRGGGGGGSCYNCNRSGHIARECPDGGRDGGRSGGGFGGGRGGGGYGGGGRACYNCNQEGHMARDCSQPDRRDR